jgi:hypothetical protein
LIAVIIGTTTVALGIVCGICDDGMRGFSSDACSKQPRFANTGKAQLGDGGGGDVLGTSFIDMDGLGVVNDDPSREEGRAAATFGQGVGGGGEITMPAEVACDGSAAGGWITFARGAGVTGIFVHIFGF